MQARRLARALADAITDFSRREGATPFMTFFAAFAILLSRLTGVADIVVGSPIAGTLRTRRSSDSSDFSSRLWSCG